jgi:hypothetical protein
MVEQEYKHLDKFPIQVQFQFLPPQFIMFNKTMYRCKERPSKMKRDTKMAVPAGLPKRESCPNYHPPDLTIYILIIVGEKSLLASQSCMDSGRRSKDVQNLLQSSRSTTTAAAAASPL